jgi:hypothetical protein
MKNFYKIALMMMICFFFLGLLSTKLNAQYFKFAGGNAADPVWTLYIEGLQIGDEIAAYDGEILVGAMKVVSTKAFENALPVFSTLNSSRGYQAGNPVILKVWDSLTQSTVPFEYTMAAPYNKAYMENIYPAEDGLYSIININKNENNIENAKESISIYPNQLEGIFTIENLSGFQNLTDLEVSDISGKVVYQLAIENNPAFISFQTGRQTKMEIDLSMIEKGVYFISFSGKNISQVKKIVIR